MKLERPERLDTDKLEALKELFPQVFSDGKINFEALREELADEVEELAPGDEHYGLSWPGKREAKRLASKGPTGTLRPVPGEGVNEDTTKNLIIEGDNLEVLRIMQKAYAGRIKMIYIDPPYNTGNDFVYKDDFKEPVESYLERTGQADDTGFLMSNPISGGRFHSNWLNMMYPRLRLARNLLKPDGSIFISIDDNEAQNLKALLDEVFGEENFLSCVCWQKKYAPANDKTDFSATHEFVFVYAKNIRFSDAGNALAVLNKLGRTDEQNKLYKNPDGDVNGPWMSGDYTCNKTVEQRPNLYFPITHPKSGKEIWPSRTAVWRYSKERHEQNERENRIWWGLNKNNETPRFKRYLSEVGGVVADTWWEFEKVGHTDEAKKEFRQLFPDAGDAFDTPKPVRMMRRILELATNPGEECFVLDFFAGSGTLGQAVFQANEADEGLRQFILVQAPEPTRPGSAARELGLRTIADVCRERQRRIVKKLKSDAVDAGFKSVSLDQSSFRKWTGETKAGSGNLAPLYESLESPFAKNWTIASAVSELMLLEGYPLDSGVTESPDFTANTVTKVQHPDQDTQLLICLEETINANTIAQAANFAKTTFICLDSALTDESKLQLDDKITLKTL